MPFVRAGAGLLGGAAQAPTRPTTPLWEILRTVGSTVKWIWKQIWRLANWAPFSKRSPQLNALVMGVLASAGLAIVRFVIEMRGVPAVLLQGQDPATAPLTQFGDLLLDVAFGVVIALVVGGPMGGEKSRTVAYTALLGLAFYCTILVVLVLIGQRGYMLS